MPDVGTLVWLHWPIKYDYFGSANNAWMPQMSPDWQIYSNIFYWYINETNIFGTHRFLDIFGYLFVNTNATLCLDKTHAIYWTWPQVVMRRSKFQKEKYQKLPAKFLLTSNAMQCQVTVPPLIWSGNEEADLCKKWDCNREIISDNGEFWSKAISVILNQYGHMPAQNNIWKQQKINFEDSKNLFSH